eukprot:8900536-Pyramimonas_sp.AAC.1
MAWACWSRKQKINITTPRTCEGCGVRRPPTHRRVRPDAAAPQRRRVAVQVVVCIPIVMP